MGLGRLSCLLAFVFLQCWSPLLAWEQIANTDAKNHGDLAKLIIKNPKMTVDDTHLQAMAESLGGNAYVVKGDTVFFKLLTDRRMIHKAQGLDMWFDNEP